jgi:hypothetical protein
VAEAEQVMQASAAAPDELPATQLVHEPTPAAENFSALQGRHTPEPATAYVPAEQVVQEADPEVAKVPNAQDEQLVAPPPEYESASQFEQLDDPPNTSCMTQSQRSTTSPHYMELQLAVVELHTRGKVRVLQLPAHGGHQLLMKHVLDEVNSAIQLTRTRCSP